LTQFYGLLSGLLLALGSTAIFAEQVVGSDAADVLTGTPLKDEFMGGAGADTFVIHHLGSEADEIKDFTPEEGDRIQLVFPQVRRWNLDDKRLSINRRGVVTYRVFKDQEVPIIDTGRSDLSVRFDSRKGRTFLKFEMKL